MNIATIHNTARSNAAAMRSGMPAAEMRAFARSDTLHLAERPTP
jgi:hypothetical protein